MDAGRVGNLPDLGIAFEEALERLGAVPLVEDEDLTIACEEPVMARSHALRIGGDLVQQRRMRRQRLPGCGHVLDREVSYHDNAHAMLSCRPRPRPAAWVASAATRSA